MAPDAPDITSTNFTNTAKVDARAEIPCLRPMAEPARAALIHAARRHGGLGLRYQDLKVHKNGVKFTISKKYVSDHVLDATRRYTLVLIPEEPSVVQLAVAVTHRTPDQGARVVHAYPEPPAATLNTGERAVLAQVLSAGPSQGISTREFGTTRSLHALNLGLAIPSRWSAEAKEQVVLSVVHAFPSTKRARAQLRAPLEDAAGRLASCEYLYKGFYSRQNPLVREADLHHVEEARALVRAVARDLFTAVVDARSSAPEP